MIVRIASFQKSHEWWLDTYCDICDEVLNHYYRRKKCLNTKTNTLETREVFRRRYQRAVVELFCENR